MYGQRVDIVWDRLKELQDLMWLSGAALDRRPGTSQVDPVHKAVPLAGLVEIAAELEGTPVPVAVYITELWRLDTDGAHARRGASVHSYTYKAVWLNEPSVTVHYDRDTRKDEPEIHHWHPPFVDTPAGRRRRRRLAGDPVQPGQALSAGWQLAASIELLLGQGLKDPMDIVDNLDVAEFLP
ncbi:MAG: hypothetical protein QOJ29_1944 [Thermoleophilaceae bacterium]|nr:hypothetical protein [Thermoleophilaceae bacterium]